MAGSGGGLLAGGSVTPLPLLPPPPPPPPPLLLPFLGPPRPPAPAPASPPLLYLPPITPSDGLGFGTPVAAAPVIATGGRLASLTLAFGPGLTFLSARAEEGSGRSLIHPVVVAAAAEPEAEPDDIFLAPPPPSDFLEPSGDEVLLFGFLAVAPTEPAPNPPGDGVRRTPSPAVSAALPSAAATAAAAALAPADAGECERAGDDDDNDARPLSCLCPVLLPSLLPVLAAWATAAVSSRDALLARAALDGEDAFRAIFVGDGAVD